jgi:small subunit ribosomal protein S2
MKDESLPKPQVEPSNSDLALSTLLASGAALGCSSAKINPHFAHYVYGNRAGLSIIDLDQTLPLLRRAANVVRDVVKNDGVVLFVGHRPLLKKSLEKAKGRLGDNGYTTTRWTPGVLTNAESL